MKPIFSRTRGLIVAGAGALLMALAASPGLALTPVPPPQIPPKPDLPPVVIPIPPPSTTPIPPPIPAPGDRTPDPVSGSPTTGPATPGGAPAGPLTPAPADAAAAPAPAAPLSRPEDFKPSPQEALDLPLNLDRLYYEGEQLILTDQFAQFEHDFGQAALQSGGGAGSFGPPLLANRQIIMTQLFGCTEFDLEPYQPGCSSHHWHSGTDWAAPAGMPVFAADAGVVRLFRDPGGYGNHAVIIHGNGFVTLYGHLQGFAVQDGQVVRRGDMIGQVGSSGFSTGSHLHFEIRHDNVYLDPCAYLGC